MNTVTLTIRFIPGSGQAPEITGPIADKMLCYALLELARDAIKDFKPPTEIIPVTGFQINGQRPRG
jgi:hypothetical protein